LDYKHLLRLHDVVSMSSFDTIHTIGLGIAKRVLKHVLVLIKHFGVVPERTPIRQRPLIRDKLIKELDRRMQSDDLTYLVSPISGNCIRKVSKSLRSFTNLTAKEYQFAIQKLLLSIGPGEVPSSILPEFVASDLRKVLMMISDLLLLGSFSEWGWTEFELVCFFK
jgi:hypothetical protein